MFQKSSSARFDFFSCHPEEAKPTKDLRFFAEFTLEARRFFAALRMTRAEGLRMTILVGARRVLGLIFLFIGMAAHLGVVGPVFSAGTTISEKEALDLTKPPYPERMADKIGRGFENFFVGYMEIPHQIQQTAAKGGKLKAGTVGFGKGLACTLVRMGAGIFEVLTFPYANEPILEPMEQWRW